MTVSIIITILYFVGVVLTFVIVDELEDDFSLVDHDYVWMSVVSVLWPLFLILWPVGYCIWRIEKWVDKK